MEKVNPLVIESKPAANQWLSVAWILFFASLPAGRPFTTWTLIILVLTSLLNFNPKSFLSTVRGNGLPFLVFYIAHLTGMLYTEDAEFGWKDLMIKLPVAVIPFIFGITPVRERFLRRAGYSFIYSCCTVAFVILIYGAYRYVAGSTEAFFYDNFSFFVHPAYLSFYFVTALLLLFDYRSDWQDAGKQTAAHVLLILILITCILLMASKAGIITGAIAALYWLLTEKKIAPGHKKIMIITGALFLVILLTVMPVRHRITDACRSLSNPEKLYQIQEGTAMRLIAWQTAARIAYDYFPLGTGTGDVKHVTLSYYEKAGCKWPLYYRLNAHNQFLQTLAACGVLGLLSLLWMLFRPLNFWSRLGTPARAFFVILILNLMVESMLEVQNGVMFISAMIPFMLLKEQKDDGGCNPNRN